MTRRLLELLLMLAAGAAWGLARGSAIWAFLGSLLGASVWLVIDGLRARRMLDWLSRADVSVTPRLSGIWQDLFERCLKTIKKLEKKARNSDARLANFLAAIQASPNGVVLLDATGKIEWVNLTAATHLGLDAQRDGGQYIQNLVRAPAFTSYLSGDDFGTEVQISPLGSRPLQPSKISLQIHPYGSKRKLMLTRDVTALELAEAMRRDFVANVSHEIRTPLTVLSGFIETLQTLPLEAVDKMKYLGLMSQQAQRMQTLVSDLLTLSRLEGSPVPGQGEWLDSEALLSQALGETRALSKVIAVPPHDIVWAPGPGFDIAGSKTELLSAMSNLLSNAVRYTPGGGTVRTGWRLREDDWAEFFVEDTGPGITAEHLPRLTERFYRVDHSRSRETGGTGLGLAIVKHVAQRHSGQISIQSIIGKGSRFSITFPPPRVKRPDRSERPAQTINSH